ncbi:MAG: tRNA (adenosine(37)-N6)-threonylcarbamoyltransferase complex ATPase subunit type 1 TsaE [Epsilonproteobacteria bacterium]|nr:tRNA (adenosine(37)-N6)-threonylcarbamoyltransferase complex ATPase subunit type 1 TsaE [Campylobacterota bacterium]
MSEKYQLTLDELDGFAKEFLEKFQSGVVIVQGDLAAGKTTLVKQFAKAKGIDEEVTSPTFSLQQCYGKDIFHYDIYNHGLEHFLSLGMMEELEKEGLHFVEWGDEALEELLISAGFDVAVITIEKIAPEKREYNICIH